jgi:hypothetical protein
MKSKKTNAKRQVVSHAVQPVVGDFGRQIERLLKMEADGVNDLDGQVWMEVYAWTSGDLCLYAKTTESDDLDVALECIPRECAILLRDFLNYAYPQNIPNATAHVCDRSEAEGT